MLTQIQKIYVYPVFIISMFLIYGSEINAQIYGCTDDKANNYNPVATVNDGSCTYNVTIYNPPVKYLLPNEIEESSGLAYLNGRLWTINDSGGLPVLYAFDTITAQILQRITIANAENIDWEALADDDQYIYIGDFGNNLGNRDDLAIYRILKSEIPLEGDGIVESTKITFSYSDYSGKVEKRKFNNFDCEAFLAYGDSLYLFSKNIGDQHTKLYRLPKTPGDYIAELVSTFNTEGLVTGADINTASNEITLVGYVSQSWVPFTWLLFDFKEDNFFSGNKRRIDFINITATQTEAIAYIIGKNEVITSEGHILFSQTAYDFNSGLWTNCSHSVLSDVIPEKYDFTLSPNPVSKSKLTISINKLPVGDYQIEIYDTLGKLVRVNKYKVSQKDGVNRIKVKVGDFAIGTYFVRMISGNQMVEKKFVKK